MPGPKFRINIFLPNHSRGKEDWCVILFNKEMETEFTIELSIIKWLHMITWKKINVTKVIAIIFVKEISRHRD